MVAIARGLGRGTIRGNLAPRLAVVGTGFVLLANEAPESREVYRGSADGYPCTRCRLGRLPASDVTSALASGVASDIAFDEGLLTHIGLQRWAFAD